jgi:hypothetical protein
VAYVVAFVLAAILGFVEQHRRLRAHPVYKGEAALVWIGRVVLEGAIGLLAVAAGDLFDSSRQVLASSTV